MEIGSSITGKGHSVFVDRIMDSPRILQELIWKRTPAYPSPYPLSFPIDAALLRATRVRWPRTLEWPTAENYVGALRTGLARLVPVDLVDGIEQGHGLVNIELVVEGRPHAVTIDYFDHFDHINTSRTSRSCVYFKMQFHRDGYRFPNVVPGGFVTGNLLTYQYIAPVRKMAAKRPRLYDVFGRFGLTFAREIRQEAIGRLREQTFFHYEGGAKLVRYSRSLEEASLSRIVIDLPSNSDFCFRLIDYFSVGACTVAWPHRTVLHVPIESGKHIVYCREDFADLIDMCRFYLKHEDKRQAVAQASREYFDRYLHRDQLAAYYLQTALRFIS